MKYIRFVFPFLFVRNWYSGEWEFSYTRFGIVMFALSLVLIFLVVAYLMQSPVEYINRAP